MRRADVAGAAHAIESGGWGDRRVHLEFTAERSASHAFVAEADGEIVGTSLGTVNGAVGWVGLVFVSPQVRGQGLGAALTARAIDVLEKAGCGTLILVATEMGRPLYERLGFRLDTNYQTFVAPGLPDGPSDPGIRPITLADAAVVAAADRLATGEDRAHLVSALIEQGDGWLLTDPAGSHRGHVIRPPWGGGSTIADDPADAIRLLDQRRRAVGPARDVRCGILDENAEGRRILESRGWTHVRTHPRLIRGRPIDWRPSAIWGQFNFALG